MNIKIECPSCARNFQVHEDLTGKMVECGGCDHRFKVEASLIIKEREKFYPGEHHDALLDRVGRSPVERQAPVNFQTANYNQGATEHLPASPTQKLAILAGVGIIIGFACVFFLGTMNTGDLFAEVPKIKRYFLAVFVLIIGGGLLIWGARNWRDKGLLLFFALTGVLVTLVTIREVKPLPGALEDNENQFAIGSEILVEEDNSALFDRMHLNPLEEAIARARAKGISSPENSVVGIYVYGVSESMENSITQYLTRRVETVGEEPPLYLPRNERDALVVVENLIMADDDLFQVIRRLGKTSEHPQKRLLEVTLNPEVFDRPSGEAFEKLTNNQNPAFYNRNLLELDQVSLDRVRAAIDRLGTLPEDAELRFKPEITKKLVQLLGQETEAGAREAIAIALRRWGSDEPEVFDQAGLIAQNLARNGVGVPPELVDFLIAAGYDEVGELIDSLWRVEPIRWQDHYRKLGAGAESRLLIHLQGDSSELRKAAIKILHNVGGKASLTALAPIKSSTDPEISILVNNARDAIQSRLEN